MTKTYNAKKDVVDESGAALTGEQLVKFDNVKNGVAQAEAGLIKKDNLGNDTTASYTEKKVGDKDRTIKYTLALSGALINNYELQDENGVAAATLTTHTNTINRRALKLKADLVTKDYDATKIVKVKVGNSVTPSTTGVGLARRTRRARRKRRRTTSPTAASNPWQAVMQQTTSSPMLMARRSQAMIRRDIRCWATV